MNPVIVNILSEYGPLGAMVLIFAYVIISLDKRHQKALNRIETEKNQQIAELKLEIKDLKALLAEIISDNKAVIRLNTVSLDKNSFFLEENAHLLKKVLNQNLES